MSLYYYECMKIWQTFKSELPFQKTETPVMHIACSIGRAVYPCFKVSAWSTYLCHYVGKEYIVWPRSIIVIPGLN
jgi:hypothetical protein